VLLFHYSLTFNYNDSYVSVIRPTPLGMLINGHAAVIFFFLLSGFVLALPYTNGDKPLKLIDFYIKRVFRIYPAYLFAILFAVLIKTYLYHPSDIRLFSYWIGQFWNWSLNKQTFIILLKTLLLVGPHFKNDLINPVIWSLVVEMKMSLLLPFFIILVSRTSLIFNLACLLIILWLTYNHQTNFLGIFYWGILLAKYKAYFINKVSITGTIALLLLSLLAIFLYNISYEFYTADTGDRLYRFPYFWRDYVTTIGGSVIIIITLSRLQLTAFLQNRLFKFMGEISYSFYLLHLPILIAICSLVASTSIAGKIAIFLLTAAISFVLSYLSYRYIETPFQRFAKRFTEKWKIAGMLKF
jgi:peptidoglycan/LPS O-acetylase OafA/YrhL